jgi:hypothetical protein
VLTVVEEREGIPLAVVKGGRPAKGDTIWLGKVPYCVTEIDNDTVVVRPGAWSDPYCASPTQMRRRSLYQVNPGPADMAGYRARPNPLDLPHYQKGPAFGAEYMSRSTPFGGRPQSTPMTPHQTPQATFEGFMQKPLVMMAYHYQFKFPIFTLETYRLPNKGERETVEGTEYEYTAYVPKHNALLVRPIIPWIAFIIAEDKGTGDGLAWVPVTHWSQVHNAKQWLKKKLDREQGVARKQYHLYRKTGRQLTGYFRNNPNTDLPSVRRG